MPSISYHTRNSINSIIKHTCDMNGVPWLASLINFRFNNKLTSTWGKAHGDKKLIELSTLMWLARPEERYDTVVHEVCHIIVWYKHGSRVKHHGKEWRECMRHAKVNPKVGADGSITV